MSATEEILAQYREAFKAANGKDCELTEALDRNYRCYGWRIDGSRKVYRKAELLKFARALSAKARN